MAFTTFNTTDTLEQVRVKLNNLTQNDFGDPSILASAGLSSTSICGAVVEIAATVFSSAGWRVEDVTSTFQLILPGEKLRVLGTSNQIDAVVSSPDILTLSLTNNVTIPGNITANGSLHTLGTFEISGNILRSTDSTRLQVNDTLRCSAVASGTGLVAMFENAAGFPVIESFRNDKFLVINATPVFNSSIFFEGATDDAFETSLTVIEPTADRVISLPNITGTLITNADTATVSNTMLAGSITGGKLLDSAIIEAKIADGAVAAVKLKNVVTLQILNSSGGVLKTIYGAGA